MGTVIIVAVRSIFYAPALYGMGWLSFHHAPTVEMWFAFFTAAMFFTRPKTQIKKNTAQPQRPSSAIILPASLRHGRDDFRE